MWDGRMKNNFIIVFCIAVWREVAGNVFKSPVSYSKIKRASFLCLHAGCEQSQQDTHCQIQRFRSACHWEVSVPANVSWVVPFWNAFPNSSGYNGDGNSYVRRVYRLKIHRSCWNEGGNGRKFINWGWICLPLLLPIPVVKWSPSFFSFWGAWQGKSFLAPWNMQNLFFPFLSEFHDFLNL